MRTVRLSAALLVAGLFTVVPAGPVSAADPVLGGYTATVSASPVTVRIYEPVIPLPTSPQAEGDVAFSQVSTSTGPSVLSVASALWPGAGLGDGFGTISETLGLGAQNYPVVARATFPGGQHEATNDMGVATMTVTAGEKGGTAVATTGQQFPVTEVLSAGQVSSTTTTTLTDTRITAKAVATASDLVLGGGVIRVQGVNAESTASSGALTATSVGRSVVTGLSIAGTEFVVDEAGLHVAGSATEIPGIPAEVADGLAQLGIAVSGPAEMHAVDGADASWESYALQISIDTRVLRDALSGVVPYRDLYNELIGMLPPELQEVLNNPMVPSLVELGPKVVYNLGVVRASTSGSPFFGFVPGVPTLPPVTGGIPGDGAVLPGPVLGGPSSTPAPDPVIGLPPAVATPVAAELPRFFDGLPAWLLLGGLALASLGAFGLRHMAGYVGMAAGGREACSLGAGGGVPNLREG